MSAPEKRDCYTQLLARHNCTAIVIIITKIIVIVNTQKNLEQE